MIDRSSHLGQRHNRVAVALLDERFSLLLRADLLVEGTRYAPSRRPDRRHRNPHDVESQCKRVDPRLDARFEFDATFDTAPREDMVEIVGGKIVAGFLLGDDGDRLPGCQRTCQKLDQVSHAILNDDIGTDQRQSAARRPVGGGGVILRANGGSRVVVGRPQDGLGILAAAGRAAGYGNLQHLSDRVRGSRFNRPWHLQMDPGLPGPSTNLATSRDDTLFIRPDDHAGAQCQHDDASQNRQRRQGPSQQAVEPTPRHFNAELVVDQLAHHLAERLRCRQESEHAAVESGPRNLPGPAGAVGPQKPREQDLNAHHEHHRRHGHGDDSEEPSVIQDGCHDRACQNQGRQHKAAHQVAGAATQKLPLANTGIAADPAGRDERDEGDRTSHEEQPHWVDVWGKRGDDERIIAGCKRTESPEECCAGSDEIRCQQKTHRRQAVAQKVGKPLPRPLQFVGKVSKENRRSRILRGEFFRRQRLSPLGLVLAVDQRQNDPDRQSAKHVPRGGLDGGALRPEADQGRRHGQCQLDQQADDGGGGATAVDEFVVCQVKKPFPEMSPPRADSDSGEEPFQCSLGSERCRPPDMRTA